MLAELLHDTYALYSDSHEGVHLEGGAVVEITDSYTDNGYWSDGGWIGKFESPFPAYVFILNGVKYCSVHQKCFSIIDSKHRTNNSGE